MNNVCISTFQVILLLLYSFFWVILWSLNFKCRFFRTLCPFNLHRWRWPMKMEQTECSEMSAHKIRMPGNHPKERYNIQNMVEV